MGKSLYSESNQKGDDEMTRTEDKFNWCLRKGKGKYHRGIKKVKSSDEESKKHIEKALHNLKAMKHNIKGGFTDWAVNAGFYSMYHSFLAILSKVGYESRNQECTFTTIEHLIDLKKIKLTKKDVKSVRNVSKGVKNDAKTMREDMQYGTKTEIEKEKLEVLEETSKEIVNKVRIVLKEMEDNKKKRLKKSKKDSKAKSKKNLRCITYFTYFF